MTGHERWSVPVNQSKLRDAEALFLQMYPNGFADEGLADISRRHKVEQLSEFAREALAKKQFSRPAALLEDVTRIVSRSSMISMFEKPRFRDFVAGLARSEREQLVAGYKAQLHGSQQRGFEAVLDVLSEGKLARWSLMSIVAHHYRPQREVFVKPTTTKNVIRHFELEGLEYKPRPSWAFYKAYRAAIEEMKAQVHPSLSPNNAAFTGFLMITTGGGAKP